MGRRRSRSRSRTHHHHHGGTRHRTRLHVHGHGHGGIQFGHGGIRIHHGGMRTRGRGTRIRPLPMATPTMVPLPRQPGSAALATQLPLYAQGLLTQEEYQEVVLKLNVVIGEIQGEFAKVLLWFMLPIVGCCIAVSKMKSMQRQAVERVQAVLDPVNAQIAASGRELRYKVAADAQYVYLAITPQEAAISEQYRKRMGTANPQAAYPAVAGMLQGVLGNTRATAGMLEGVLNNVHAAAGVGAGSGAGAGAGAGAGGYQTITVTSSSFSNGAGGTTTTTTTGGVVPAFTTPAYPSSTKMADGKVVNEQPTVLYNPTPPAPTAPAYPTVTVPYPTVGADNTAANKVVL